MSISPSVGISVVTNTTEAQVGAPDAANDPLSVGGDFSATATHTGSDFDRGRSRGRAGRRSLGGRLDRPGLRHRPDHGDDRPLHQCDRRRGDVRGRRVGCQPRLVERQRHRRADQDRGVGRSRIRGRPTAARRRAGSDTADPNSVDGQNAQARDFADSESTITDSKGNTVSAGDTKSDAKTPAAETSDGSVTVAAAVAVNIVDSAGRRDDPRRPHHHRQTGPLTVNATNDTGNPANPIYPANPVIGDTANAWGTDAGTAKVGIGAAVALNLVKRLGRGDDRGLDDQRRRRDRQCGNGGPPIR